MENLIKYEFYIFENFPSSWDLQDLRALSLKTGVESLQIVNEVSQSYITQLWNNDIFKQKKNIDRSFIHPWSRYFTIVLLSLAAIAGIYWAFVEPKNILPAISAALIVACPCSLLLSSTFTFGNMLRYFGKNKLYLKNASVIEALSKR